MSATRELQREVRELHATLAQRDARIAALEQRATLLAQELAATSREKALIEQALKEALRRRTGRDLDDPAQLRLLFGEPPAPEVTPPHADEAPDGETPDDRIAKRHRPRRAARRLDASRLPREHVTHELPPDARVDPATGKTLVEVGETIFEELHYTPARLVVREHHRKVYGLPPEEAAAVVCAPRVAPLPPRPIEKSPASAQLLAWLMVQKYRHHLPLYRQEAIFAREGLAIPRQTACDWIAACAALLEPIQAALRRRILGSGVVQLDDTPVQCQQGKGGSLRQAYLWVLCSPLVEGVVYAFTPGRGYDDVQPLLGDLAGVLVGDGYAVHDKLAGASGGRLVTAGCWSHALRKYRDALREAPGAAAEMVVAIGQLFELEREADRLDMSSEERLALRQARAPALLADIEAQRRALEGTTSAAGPLAEATTYLANQWASLTRFLADGRVPIHNNACERAIRPVAVGRRNWLFAGSARGGASAATIYTLVESCRQAGVDPFAYFADVLVRVSSHPARLVEELLPAQWKLRFGADATR
jgi:transposase